MAKKPDPVDIHVGSRLRMRRLTVKMSQTDLGSGAGITFQQVQKYEKGTNRISSSRLQQFAGLLNVSVPFFFDDQPAASKKGAGYDPEARDARALNDFMATKDRLALVNAYRRIKNRTLRLSLVHLVERLSGQA
jgi:transcriptional regulator with XRE-family HTH domain